MPAAPVATPQSLLRRVRVANCVVRFLLRCVFRLLVRVDIVGLENLPSDGPVIVCGNHRSYADGFLLFAFITNIDGFLLTSRIFDKQLFGPYIGTSVGSKLWRWFGHIRVDKTNATERQNATFRGVRLLQQGGGIGIFPEGQRVDDDEAVEGAKGAAFMSMLTGAPVVPVALVGTGKFWPKGKRPRVFPRRKLYCSIGQPLHPPDKGVKRERDKVQKDFTASIMAAIGVLSRT